MHGWVLDCFLILSRSESLGHCEALKWYQPVICQEFKDAKSLKMQGLLCGTHAFDIRTQWGQVLVL